MVFFNDKQACAFGPGRVSLLSFDGDSLDDVLVKRETSADTPEAAVFVWALAIVRDEWKRGGLSDDHAVRLESELSGLKRKA